MKTISCAPLILTLGLAISPGCSSESSPADDKASWASTSSGDTAPDPDGIHAERARIAASGRYLAPDVQAIGPTVATSWTDALDIPGEFVTAASLLGPAAAAGIFNNDGAVIVPVRGTSFVMLSTGLAGVGFPEPGTDLGVVGPDGDSVSLVLDLIAPPNANRLSIQYNFLSAEAPDFVGTDYNDTFSITVIGSTEARTFDLASVNSSQFFEVSSSRAKGSKYEIYTGEPGDIDGTNENNAFGPTGLPDAGLTGFQSFDIDVEPGVPLQVRLSIADQFDGILDSAILLDAFQFSTIEAVDPNPDLVAVGGKVTSSLADLAAKGRHVRGAVADGVTEVLLRMKLPGPGQVTFSVLGANPSADGGFVAIGDDALPQINLARPTDEVDGAEFAFAVFRAPADFSRGAADQALVERPIQIRASYVGDDGSQFGSQTELVLRRPPVVLAQGLWTKTFDWLKSPNLTTDPTLSLTFVDRLYSCDDELRLRARDYSQAACPWQRTGPTEGATTCSAAVGTTVDQATKEALVNVRRLGLAGTQVDVVAHGVGGIHARQYINSDGYRNPANLEQGDVNRLITINTPHFGSRVANAAVTARQAFAAGADRELFLCQARSDASAPVEPGDIDETIPASITLAETPVPGHAIVGTGGNRVNRQGARQITVVGTLYTLIDNKLFPTDPNVPPPPAPPPPPTPKILSNPSAVFGTLDHDLFVDVNSQRGGVEERAVSRIPLLAMSPTPVAGATNNDYFRSLWDPRVADRIKVLLNSPVDGPLFDRFKSPPITPVAPEPTSAVAADEQGAGPQIAADGRLRIVSPANGTQVLAGGRVRVEVAAQSGFVPVTVSILVNDTILTREAPPYVFDLSIPADSLGPIMLNAVAFDANENGALADGVALIAQTTAIIQTVSIVNQDPVLFGIGTRRQLTVLGRFNDDVTRDVTSGLTGTAYRTSDLDVVQVTTDGTIIAIHSGVATVTAKNGNTQDSITVTVKGNGKPLAVASGDSSLTCVAPGVEVPVQLDGSASFDPDGDPLTYTWAEGEVLLATGPNPTVELGAGVHTIDLQVSDGQGEFAHATVTISVEEDSAPPSVTVVGPDPSPAECGVAYTDGGATALDACDGDLSGAIVAQSDVNTGRPGGYSVSYRVQDEAGLVGSATRSVVVRDTQPPQLTVLGSSTTTTECAAPYSDPGASARDLCDGDLTSAITTQSTVNPSAPGTYTVTYQVRDQAGLARTATRSVAVVDRTPPVVEVDPMQVFFPALLFYREFELSDCACVEDTCGGELNIDLMGDIVAIHSDEPDVSAPNDPDHDIVIVDHSSFLLRQQQLTEGNGRVYEIEFTVRDGQNNRTSTTSCFLGVKLAQRSRTPINDGRVYTVRP